MRLYMTFHTVVPKMGIRTIEKKIRENVFGGAVDIRIVESFDLNRAYSAAQIYDLYRDSILDELMGTDRVLYQIVKDSAFEFEGEDLTLALPDDGTAVLYEKDLLTYLDHVFTGRFGTKISITFTYRKPEKDYLSDTREKIDRQVAAIMETVAKAHADEGDVSGDAIAEVGKGKEKKKNVASGDRQKKAFSGDIQKKEGGWQERRDFRKPEGSFRKAMRRSNDPDIIYGSDTDGDLTEIATIDEHTTAVVIRGRVTAVNPIELRNRDKTIFAFSLYDGTDSITAKLFLDNEVYKALSGEIVPGKFFQVRGSVSEDKWSRESTVSRVYGIKKIQDFFVKREDTAKEKRVELHCHTNMSDSDGVSDVTAIVKQAIRFGHRALAITDHGVVQAFPDAAGAAGDDLKILYGMEGYLVDDTKALATNSRGQSLRGDYVVFDLETTGLNARTCSIIEIGAVYVRNGEIVDRFSEFCDPGMPIPYRITEITSIRDDDVSRAEKIETLLPRFRAFCGDAVLVAHNAEFDTACIKAACERLSVDWEFTYADTMTMAAFLLPNHGKLTLDAVAKALNVSLENHHRAVNDAECTANIFITMVGMLHDRGRGGCLTRKSGRPGGHTILFSSRKTTSGASISIASSPCRT